MAFVFSRVIGVSSSTVTGAPVACVSCMAAMFESIVV